jgi:hypothetical protein
MPRANVGLGVGVGRGAVDWKSHRQVKVISDSMSRCGYGMYGMIPLLTAISAEETKPNSEQARTERTQSEHAQSAPGPAATTLLHRLRPRGQEGHHTIPPDHGLSLQPPRAEMGRSV